MKKFLSVVTVAAVMAACNTNKDNSTDKAAIIAAYQDSVKKAADTAGLSEFQNWKAQNELATVEQYNTAQFAAVPVAQKAVRTSSPARAKSVAKRTSSASNGNGTMNSESSNTAMKKKGWSKAAKGAAIGTAGGAVAGAVINKKNRVVGGVVGGILGAGVGYGVGRQMDKKDGRY